MQISKEDILERTNLFGGIKTESRRALAEICLPKTVEKKQTLFWQGDRGEAIYVLVAGSIRLTKAGPDRDVVIKVVKPGEMFGEVVLFERNTYPVTATALKTSTVYILPKRQFTCLLTNESFRNDFMAALMGKMRYLTSQIQYLTSHDVEDRVFLFLEEQYGRFTTVNVGISKKDLALSIGATPETLSRLLQRLREEKSLSWEGNTVKVNPSVWERGREE